ncbi:pancreatic progenitor cell differentiation and proliferation factor-like [Neomonachus schauinslandi]|uniref:Pancreatic progenitor cell differentiation and proliferation factor-like n=1 Tax=Neomonachus schauinslandi TaxID=29088 RepID=A0A8M1M8L2_NEOSC|nr:pancreatic progenitor cell differentiation and proliferation factor-like [Neomonachus schauinslandi]
MDFTSKRGGYKSLDLGDRNQMHFSHQNKDGVETPASDSLAAIPSSGSLVASHDYYWCRLGSLSSNSSCRSAEYAGEAIPHHRSLPKADPGHWWASFFFGKSTLPYSAAVLESPERLASSQASSSRILWDLALEAMRKQPGGQPGKANMGPPS